MHTESTLLELVDLIYSTDEDPARWTIVIERLARAVRGQAASLHHHHLVSNDSNFSELWNIDPTQAQSYVDYYGSVNPWMFANRHLVFPGAFDLGQMLCPDEVFYKIEYYNDLIGPNCDDLSQIIVLTLFDDGRFPPTSRFFGPEEGKSSR